MSSDCWPLRDVTLKVLNLEAQLIFYKAFGFRQIAQSENRRVLTAGDGFQLTLVSPDNLKPRPPISAGLFHFAILVPDRATLGSFLRHAVRQRWNFVGAADHLVSEALYFSDPERNGIEVYVDRPSEMWRWENERIEMATLPLDLDALIGSGTGQWSGFPVATRLGHMHLTVTDLDASQEFYESLGMKLTANWGPFRFLSYDGYHHHLGINLAAGHNAVQPAAEFSGLESFSIERDTVESSQPDPSRIIVATKAGRCSLRIRALRN